MTCYYISESWEYKEVLIGFEPIEGSHTGENLGYAVKDVLTRHDLTHRLLAITADNASNNGTLRWSLESWLGTQQVTWDAESMKVNCLAHVFHLSAKVLLAGIELYDDDYDDDDYDVGPTVSESDDIPQVTSGVASTVHKVSESSSLYQFTMLTCARSAKLPRQLATLRNALPPSSECSQSTQL